MMCHLSFSLLGKLLGSTSSKMHSPAGQLPAPGYGESQTWRGPSSTFFCVWGRQELFNTIQL